jgi:hypothetical protein
MIARMRPLPSAISPGHLPTKFQLRSSSFVSLKYPSSKCPTPIPSQKPFVDRALNWHGHPHAQLKFTNWAPRIIHLSFMVGGASWLAGNAQLPLFYYSSAPDVSTARRPGSVLQIRTLPAIRIGSMLGEVRPFESDPHRVVGLWELSSSGRSLYEEKRFNHRPKRLFHLSANRERIHSRSRNSCCATRSHCANPAAVG